MQIPSRTALDTPRPHDLIDVLRSQRRRLESLLYRSTLLTLLTESGQHRFLGWAVDELEQARIDLAATEILRSAVTEAMLDTPAGHQPSLSEALAMANEEEATELTDLAEQIRELIDSVDEVKRRGIAVAVEKTSAVDAAITTLTDPAPTYGRSGLSSPQRATQRL